MHGREMLGISLKGFMNWNKCEMFLFLLFRNWWLAAREDFIYLCFGIVWVDVGCKIKAKETMMMRHN